MKKKLALIGCTIILFGTTAYSVNASSTPGTSGDPLVSKSYVDEAISNLMTALSGNGSATVDEQVVIEGVLNKIGDLDTLGKQAFEPVNVKKGQILLGGEGAEIILRSGSAISYCAGTDGMIDTTTGTEFFNGTNLIANHLLIVPRDDGRGAVVTSEEAWFIVKGGYTIK